MIVQVAWNLNEFYVGEDGGEALGDLAAEGRTADADEEEGGEVAAARLLGDRLLRLPQSWKPTPILP